MWGRDGSGTFYCRTNMSTQYVYKGINEWSPKWRRHGWRSASREVGHRDLWEAILQLREQGGGHVRLEWTPSHVRVQGNEHADQLAEASRLQHPNNKRRRTEPEWESLGLHPMDSGASSSDGDGSGEGSATSSEASWSQQSEAGVADSAFSTESSSTGPLSDSASSVSCSDESLFSTDVSETNRKRARHRGREPPPPDH